MDGLRKQLRRRLLQRAGCHERLPRLEVLRTSEWCPSFEQLMRNRLIIGAFRYGRNFQGESSDKPQYDRVGRILRYCEQYQKTGNLEILVDIANTAMLEFGEGNHPDAHFSAIDDGEHTKEKQ